MEIILLERVEKLGQMGDVVTVKDGYARNFLLPQKKALRSTDANKKYFEDQRAQLEARNLERKSEAESVAEKLDGQAFVLIRQAGESGQLYGSVAARDIASAASASGVSVGRNQVVLNTPFKALGLYEVRIVLHPEVSAMITINIARTEEEAERQARGEDVTADRFAEDEEEEGLAAEDAFETQELAAEASSTLNDVEPAEEERAESPSTEGAPSEEP